MSEERRFKKCLFCGLLFMPVDFLPYRLFGYCTEGCMAHERRTAPSKESIAYKNGFPLKRILKNED